MSVLIPSRVICQINGRFDEVRKTRLPAQCCGLPADQVYKCEQIAPPGHQCEVNEHTILHERMGNGWGCGVVEEWIRDRGGLSGWCEAQYQRAVRNRPDLNHPFEGDGEHCKAWRTGDTTGSAEVGYLTMSIGCGYPRAAHQGEGHE